MLKAIPQNNGLEMWRTLVRTLAPTSKSRSLALLGAISQFPVMNQQNYHEQLLKLEELRRKYQQASGKEVLKAAILLLSLPASIRTHVSLQCPEDATDDTLREVVLRYERSTQKWTTQVVTGIPSTSSDGPVPMEIDRVYKGNYKGMGKDKDGRDGHKSNYKNGKGGNSWFSGPKGQGKNNGGGRFGKGPGDKGKGKVKGKGTPSQSSPTGQPHTKGSGKVPYDTCKTCGDRGHWSKECWMNAKNKINEVQNGSPQPTSTSMSLPTSSPHATYREPSWSNAA